MRQVAIGMVVLALAACSSPLADVDRLSDIDVPADATSSAALPDASQIDTPEGIASLPVEGPNIAQLSSETPQSGAAGFLRGLIQRAANADPASAVAADVAAAQSAGTVSGIDAAAPDASSADAQVAALAPESQTRGADAAQNRGFLGLLGGGATNSTGARSGPDTRDVPLGTLLPFGEIARVCEARGKEMGKRVEQQARRGFTLYDTNPGIRDKRTFYLTGFSDNCPRQFTAANALFGAPSFYEQLRFGPAGEHLPHAATDKAYDRVKTSVCSVRKNKPCGSAISRLDRTSAFISAYEFHEYNGAWKEFFVHDGQVVAAAVKSVN